MAVINITHTKLASLCRLYRGTNLDRVKKRLKELQNLETILIH